MTHLCSWMARPQRIGVLDPTNRGSKPIRSEARTTSWDKERSGGRYLMSSHGRPSPEAPGPPVLTGIEQQRPPAGAFGRRQPGDRHVHRSPGWVVVVQRDLDGG